MRNHNGDGIICDYCGIQVNSDFTYYSFDFYEVTVTNKIKNIAESPNISIDFCESCMELYREQVQRAYRPPVPNQFSCDISGEVIQSSNFNYARCLISKVDVVLSTIPYKCSQCSKIRNPKDGPCAQCTKDTKLTRDAEVTVDDKYLELNFSWTMYLKFKDHLARVKTIGASEWSTQE